MFAVMAVSFLQDAVLPALEVTLAGAMIFTSAWLIKRRFS